MENQYRYLGDRMITESAQGGQARYRAARHGTNPQAQQLAELRLLNEERPHRVLKLRLPRLRTLYVRLLRWALIGTPSA